MSINFNTNIYIAGHTGMVGSSILRKLKAQGYQNLIMRKHSELDLADQKKVKDFFFKYKPDQVYLSAAKVGGIYANNTYPADFIYENLMIQNNIINAAFLNGVKKILFLGSSCIYPKITNQPINEESLLSGKLEPTNSPYAMAKLTAIEIGNAMHLEYGHKVINLMPTNLYGPNDYFSELNSHVIPGLIMRMHKAKLNNDKEFLIWGSGNPLREFLHVDDLAKAIDTIIKSDTSESLINVGSSEEITIKELAKEIKLIVGYEGDLNFDSSKPDGNPRKLLDSTKINQLGWHPEIDLKSGLKNTYKWFVDNSEL